MDDSLGKDISMLSTDERDDSIIVSVHNAANRVTGNSVDDMIDLLVTIRRHENALVKDAMSRCLQDVVDMLLADIALKHAHLIRDSMLEESLRRAAGTGNIMMPTIVFVIMSV